MLTLDEIKQDQELLYQDRLKEFRTSETYRDRVTEIIEAKCWTRLGLENLGRIQMRRTRTNQNLVSQLEGEEIEIEVTRWPPLRAKDIFSVKYRGQQVYPIKPSD